MSLIYAIVHDNKLHVNGLCRSTFLQPYNSDDSDDSDDRKEYKELKCVKCEKPIKYKSNEKNILAVFCCKEHYDECKSDYLITPKCETILMQHSKRSKTNKPDKCPSCNGPSTRGRGFAHKDDCPETSQNKRRLMTEKRLAQGNCPYCDGPPGKRRGWKHKENCTKGKEAVVLKPPCPKCGGLRRGRGYMHKDGCPLKKNKE